MPGVEFIEPPDVSGDEDLLDTSSDGGIPRGVWLAIVLLVVAALGVAGIAKLTSKPRHHPVANPRSGATLPPDLNTQRSGIGAEVPGVSGLQVIDIAQMNHELFVYQRGLISIFDVSGDRPVLVKSRPIPELGRPDATDYRIVTDPTLKRIWLVGSGDSGEIREYTVPELAEARSMSIDNNITSAVTLGGHLWLATQDGIVADLPPSAQSTDDLIGVDLSAEPISGQAMLVVADRVRNRIIVSTAGPNSVVLAVDPESHRATPSTFLPYIDGSVAVVDQALWAVGLGRTYAVVTKLDPLTMTGIQNAGLSGDANLGDEADVVAMGSRALWIRASKDPSSLWCLDGSSGDVAQYWNDVSGPVTSVSGSAFAVAGGRVVQLPLTNCDG